MALPGLKAQANVSGNQRQLITVQLKQKSDFLVVGATWLLQSCLVFEANNP